MVQAQVNNDASARDTKTVCDESPLMIAALNGSFDVVEWLYKNGASLSVTAPNGNTTVHYSAASGCPRTLQYILAQEGMIEYVNYLNKVKILAKIEMIITPHKMPTLQKHLQLWPELLVL